MEPRVLKVNNGEKCIVDAKKERRTILGPATVVVLNEEGRADMPGPNVVPTKVDIVRMKETLQDELMSAIHNSGLSYGDAISVIQRVEGAFMNKGRNFLKGVDIREVADQSSLPI